MTNAFTLDDINQVLEDKYAPFVFQHGREKFTLKPILRLPKDARQTVRAQLQVLEDGKENMEEDEILDILKSIVAEVTDENKAERLFEILDNDLVKVTVLFEKWLEKTQAGEA